MRHNNAAVMAISRTPNPTKFQKTLGLNDFYFGADDWEYPLGHIQMLGKTDGVQVEADGLPGLPAMAAGEAVRLDCAALDRFLADLRGSAAAAEPGLLQGRQGPSRPDARPTRRRTCRLREKLRQLCGRLDIHPHLLDRSLYLGKDIPIGGTAHQAGTLRFGRDPASSVLDLACKAHDLDNLYVTDASFFPSIGAVNPTLTIIANALRVADLIEARLKGSAARP